jgi:quercetin dioxygenase-like cupin family protein
MFGETGIFVLGHYSSGWITDGSTTSSESMIEPEITRLNMLEKTPHAEVFDHNTPRTVRLKIDAEQQMPPHRHPGTDIVLHLITGELDLVLDEEIYALTSGDLIRFSGECEISPRAIEDSVAIVVFSPSD